jgi:hypothetical protein
MDGKEPMRRAIAAAAISLVAFAAASGASAQTGTSNQGQPGSPQWATVNVCRPGAVGVRASIPGSFGADRMQVRFSLQWFSPGRRTWLPVNGNAGSGWIAAGSASQLWTQRGFTFSVNAVPGTRFLFRGVVELRWLRGGGSVRSAVLSTGTVGDGNAVCVVG